jgi:cytochrome b involved in lipid metabolism
MADRKISTAELAEHADATGAVWTAVHGHVYDITKFSSLHPGGATILGLAAGM